MNEIFILDEKESENLFYSHLKRNFLRNLIFECQEGEPFKDFKWKSITYEQVNRTFIKKWPRNVFYRNVSLSLKHFNNSWSTFNSFSCFHLGLWPHKELKRLANTKILRENFHFVNSKHRPVWELFSQNLIV